MASDISLSDYDRIVIKIGSALVVGDDQVPRLDWIASVAEDVSALIAQGKTVIIVSSGAIAMGCASLGLKARPSRLDEAQAAACAGQIALMNAYGNAFGTHDRKVGQLLLTLSDLDGRRSYLNARATLERLLDLGVVPIINENDATATEEIRVGDNDRLAARVAQMTGADLLILLSDIDGLYTANPVTHDDAQHIPEVTEITPDIFGMAETPDPAAMSRGGMRTKLDAGKIATASGCAMMIMHGGAPSPLTRLMGGERHTVFHPSSKAKPDARQRWLSGQLGAQGSITIDDGAQRALANGNSLLAAGIIETRGVFTRGDVIRIMSRGDGQLGLGLSNYDSAEIDLIRGLKSDDIAGKLGYTRSQTVVHRDNLVLSDKGS